MTRRKFVRRLISTILAVIASVSEAILKPCLAKDQKRLPRRFAPRNDSKETLKEPSFGSPRKFVWAFRLKKYPGSLRPLRDISKPSKWSG